MRLRRFWWFVLLLTLFFAIGTLGKGLVESRPGSILAIEDHFKYIVSIIYQNQHICGGGLVASKVVVTAAQCCERIQDKHKALVSAGSLKPLSQEAHVRDVLKVGFASSTKDICIVILEEELPPHGDIVTFINIEAPQVGHAQPLLPKKCKILGWNNLIELSYENTTTNYCDTSLTNKLCTNSQFTGDEGSLLVCDGKLTAVKSNKNVPSEFVRLAPFKSEIDQNIRDSQTLKNARQKHISALLITTIVPLILSIIVH